MRDARSFADALEDEQQPLQNNETAQDDPSASVAPKEQPSPSALDTLAANDSPDSPDGNQETNLTSLQDVDESYDSVLQLLSELNAAPTTPLGLGDTPLVANNDLTAGNGSAPEGSTLFSGTLQSTQSTLISQDNQIQNQANPTANIKANPTAQPIDPSGNIQPEAQSASTPNQNIDGQTISLPSIEAPGIAADLTSQQPGLAIPTSDLAAQNNIATQNNADTLAKTAASPVSTEDQKAAANISASPEGKILAAVAGAKSVQNTAGELSTSETTAQTGDDSLRQSATPSANNTAGQSDSGDRPSSLMQRLKPLEQATPLFQAQNNAANDSFKTPDLTAPALTMTATGEIARPAGLPGMGPSLTNPSTPPVPLGNIAVHIAAQAKAGNQRFTIRLDPPELGRIDIRLEIGRDGQALTHLAVEKPETLDLLRQDSRSLERALNSAGLDSRDGALSFSLREEKQDANKDSDQDQDGGALADDNTIDENENDEAAIERTLNVASGLDIRI